MKPETKLSPEKIIVGSFLVAILIGTLFLMLPLATKDGKGLSFIDALFTATSATCVTGLTVVDTGSFLSPFGQLIVLLLIQCGGLGIMTLSTFFMVALGKRVSLRSKLILQDALNFYDMESIADLLKHIVLFTFTIETMGAVLIFLDLHFRYGYPFFKAVYFSVFHSVSAFCNAGFSLYSNSLSRFVSDPLMNLTVIGLIILGGLGFPVLYNLYRRFVRKEKEILPLHTKIVLSTTALLIALGAIFILFSEANVALKGLDLKTKILAAFFQSVTPRTAGFNTIDIGSMREVTWLALMILMFIGASPGGTGGGVKTTTFAAITASVISTIRNRKETILFKKRISEDVVRKSFSICFLSLTIICMGTILISLKENLPVIKVLFEVFSAFGTVGLSTGITSSLHSFSKLVLSVIMLTGRVGPLTVAVAMTEPKAALPIRYPEGEILVG